MLPCNRLCYRGDDDLTNPSIADAILLTCLTANPHKLPLLMHGRPPEA